MESQLTSLERKIDSLLASVAKTTSGEEKSETEAISAAAGKDDGDGSGCSKQGQTGGRH